MQYQPTTQQGAELARLLTSLAAMMGRIRETFLRRTPPGDEETLRWQGLMEEIAFTWVREDEQMLGEPMEKRRAVFRYQDALTHLQKLAEAMLTLEEVLLKGMRDGISLPEKAGERVDILLMHQGMILCTLQEAVQSGTTAHLHTAYRATKELDDMCRQCSSEAGAAWAGSGATDPGILLRGFLEKARALALHERELARLLVRLMGRSRRDAS